ncbi:hypothetical protein ES708_31431 [subsurface metagenome]
MIKQFLINGSDKIVQDIPTFAFFTVIPFNIESRSSFIPNVTPTAASFTSRIVAETTSQSYGFVLRIVIALCLKFRLS